MSPAPAGAEGAARTILKISGGAGSWAAGRKWRDENPGAPLELLFTDTLCEDQDTYRFLIAGAANLLGAELPPSFLPAIEDFPAWEDRTAYKAFVLGLAARTMMLMPGLHWLSDGLDVWDVMERERMLANSRFDTCSKYTKRVVADRWLKAECDPADTLVLVGIGPDESERFLGFTHPTNPKLNRAGIAANMLARGWRFDAPLMTSEQWFPGRVEAEVARAGLWTQRTYLLGFAHANCGTICVKAGIGHWRQVFWVFSERYAYAEWRCAQMGRLFRAVPFLTDRRKTPDNPTGAKRPLSLTELRARDLTPEEAADKGGCRCFFGDTA